MRVAARIGKRKWIAAYLLATALLSCSAKDNSAAFSYIDQNDVQGLRRELARGLSPDIFDSRGRTLLFYAIEKKNGDMVELLLKGKANPNLQTRNGKSPLFQAYANYAGKRSLTLITLLLEHGADANHAEDGAPLLFRAVETCNYELTSLLLDHGASPNVTDKIGHYPIQVIGGPFECDPKIEKQIEALLVAHGSRTMEALKK